MMFVTLNLEVLLAQSSLQMTHHEFWYQNFDNPIHTTFTDA
jgi:hypothetical protein